MKDLSTLLLAQRLDVTVRSDGSASLHKAVVGHDPWFADVIRHDYFHSKSYMVQEACLAAFDDIESIAEAVAKGYEGAKKAGFADAQLLMMMNRAGRAACAKTWACLAEQKLRKALSSKPVKAATHDATEL
mmetsp:Transcript_67128/g.148933  ORF Transcript_67128/g.148933 Transcript_67128/m.148933 type:complete len:131 (-) Transcript_67128:2-394(-)